ncbi:MAG: hypothetical protein CR991_01420 [Proteobacteria bacterium]|nr:MAG: hypothetical protein CR991_01420 [Pseudomonadota bacterium]
MKNTYRCLIGISFLLTLALIVVGAYLLAEKAWIEMMYAYAVSTLGLLILVLFLMSLFFQETLKQSLWLPSLLLITVVFQALLGMWAVTKLPAPVTAAGHLYGAMTTLSLLWLLWLFQSKQIKYSASLFTSSLLRIRLMAGVALLAVIIQIALGGWISAYDEYRILDNHALTVVRMLYRDGAVAVSLLVGGFGIWLLAFWRGVAGKAAVIILILLFIQWTLIVLNGVVTLPLMVAKAHILGASLLLLAVIAANYRLWRVHKPLE